MDSLKILYNRFKRKIRPLVHSNLNINNRNKKQISKNLNILIATSTSSNWSISSFDNLLALKLSKLVNQVNVLICDEFLNSCQECDSQWIKHKDVINDKVKELVCKDCFKPAKEKLEKLKVNYIRFSDFYKESKLSSSDYKIINEHALAGALRYLGKGSITSPVEEQVKESYQISAEKTLQCVKNINQELNPDIIICHHGIYVPQGIITDYFYNIGKKTITWVPSYRKKSFIFNQGRSYHYTMPYEKKNEWDKFNFNEEKEKQITHYLLSRKTGDNDWISFSKKNQIQIFF